MNPNADKLRMQLCSLIDAATHSVKPSTKDLYIATGIILSAILLEKGPQPISNEPKRYRCEIIIRGRRLEDDIVEPFEYSGHFFVEDGCQSESIFENDHRNNLYLDSLKVVGAGRLERVNIGPYQETLSTPSTRYQFGTRGRLSAGARCRFTIRCDKALEPPASSK